MVFKKRYVSYAFIAVAVLTLSAYEQAEQQSKSVQAEVILDSTVVNTKTIASGLNVPWEICWGPDNWIWFTEQSGTISKVDPETGQKKVLLGIPEVYRYRSLGLLGMTIHPDKSLPYVFVSYTYKSGNSLLSKLVRYSYTADTLTTPVEIIKDIPCSTGHNGSRVLIAPDGKIMISTGYGAKKEDAQNIMSLNGKILRLNIDGSIPEDNPLPRSMVFSSGHRNPQGMVFNPFNGILYSSEHGDAVDDELNIIKRGGNYGWPLVEGYNDTPDERTFFNTQAIVEPIKSWTPVIATAGIDFYNSSAIAEWKNSLLMVTLKTQTLRVLKLNNEGDAVRSEKVYFDHIFGRLRDICISPSGDVYVSTSNRDWNPADGYPKASDDKIIKIFKVKTLKSIPVANVKKTVKPALAKKNTPVAPVTKKPVAPASVAKVDLREGAVLYNSYCSSCHKTDGSGIPGTFPPLKGANQVIGDKSSLIKIITKGLSGPLTVKGVVYNQEMPSFRFLPAKSVSEITSYIRNSFGNKASLVSVQEVNNVRAAIK